MPGVSKAQIRQARDTNLFAYLQSSEPGVLKRDGPNYRHREHDSLVYVAAKDYWYWNSRGKKINALDYMMEIRGYGLVEAVNALTGSASSISYHAPVRPKPPPHPPFSLPWAKRCATGAITYLQRRGIHHQVIGRCIKLGLLYARFFLHMNNAEIARVEGCDITSVRDSINRGLRRLKKIFENLS